MAPEPRNPGEITFIVITIRHYASSRSRGSEVTLWSSRGLHSRLFSSSRLRAYYAFAFFLSLENNLNSVRFSGYAKFNGENNNFNANPFNRSTGRYVGITLNKKNKQNEESNETRTVDPPDVKPTRNHAGSDVRITNFVVGRQAVTKRKPRNVTGRNLHPKIWFHVRRGTKRTRAPAELLRTIIIMSKKSREIFCPIDCKPRVLRGKKNRQKEGNKLGHVLRCNLFALTVARLT